MTAHSVKKAHVRAGVHWYDSGMAQEPVTGAA